MQIPPYTFGVGDRFGHEGRAQLQALMRARAAGIDVSPVWNKSNREHTLIGSDPADVRREARAAVESLGWKGSYFVDADHINLRTVDRFTASSDFFTIDVAEDVGRPANPEAASQFAEAVAPYLGSLAIPGLARPFVLTPALVAEAAAKFLRAIQTAGEIYRHIQTRKGEAGFITEISVDETDAPQTPEFLFLILAMIAREEIPVQTIAPKFSGRFNKGIDYVGDLAQFEREFEDDLLVVAFAIREFGLPSTLKLSVHSGSDKFSLYPILRRLIRKHRAGLHVKTAGTTWLEEMIGLAEAGGEGLDLAREIYRGAMDHFAELTKPYASVIEIEPARLPSVAAVAGWTSAQFVAALKHDPACPAYNPHFRQLLHVAFKLAAQMGPRYTDALVKYRATIERNVTENLLDRHLRPIFGE